MHAHTPRGSLLTRGGGARGHNDQLQAAHACAGGVLGNECAPGPAAWERAGVGRQLRAGQGLDTDGTSEVGACSCRTAGRPDTSQPDRGQAARRATLMSGFDRRSAAVYGQVVRTGAGSALPSEHNASGNVAQAITIDRSLCSPRGDGGIKPGQACGSEMCGGAGAGEWLVCTSRQPNVLASWGGP